MTFSHYFPFALKNDTVVSALHRFLLVSWCKCSTLLSYRFLSQDAQNTTKSISLRNPGWCMKRCALFRPSCTSWSLSPASSRCSQSQHRALQEGGGSLLLHGAECLHRTICGFCMHISELLRPSQRETTGTGSHLGQCFLCFSSLDRTHSIPIRVQNLFLEQAELLVN